MKNFKKNIIKKVFVAMLGLSLLLPISASAEIGKRFTVTNLSTGEQWVHDKASGNDTLFSGDRTFRIADDGVLQEISKSTIDLTQTQRFTVTNLSTGEQLIHNTATGQDFLSSGGETFEMLDNGILSKTQELNLDPAQTVTYDSVLGAAASQAGAGVIGDTSGGAGGLLGGVLEALQDNSVPIKKVEDIPGTQRDLANKIAWGIAKMLVQKLTDQIVMLIRTGGQGGGPLFVQNWNTFLLDAADQASGVFIKELNLTQLCEPFAPRLRLIFAAGRRSLQERYRCTVSAVLGNIQSFFNDFNNGGWQRWIELTQVQNNPYGQYLGLLEEKEKREALGVQKSFNEAISANGFLGVKECIEQPPEEHINPNTGATELVPVEPRCSIVSPGKWLEERLVESTNSDIQQLNLADSFNEIILAAFQTMMQTLFYSGGGLASSDIRSTAITSQLENDLNNLRLSAIQFSGVESAISITQAIITKKNDSLAKVKDEIITLGKLKTCQQTRGLPTNTTENSVNAATSTKLALENNILDQTLFNETLKDNRAALLGASTVEALNQALAKTQNDVAKIGSLGAATLENAKITADKTKAESDLANCLNPPPPTSGG